MWVEEIGLERLSQRRGTPRVGRTIRDKPIRLGGVDYPHGIGTRSISEFVIDLKGNATRFESMVGFDDVIRGDVGSVTFEVWADDTRVADSGLMRAGRCAEDAVGGSDRRARPHAARRRRRRHQQRRRSCVGGAMIELLQPAASASCTVHAPCRSAPAHRCAVDVAAACHSRRARHRRDSRPSVPVPCSGDRRAAAAILGARPARRSRCSTRPPASSAARSSSAGESVVQLTVRGPGGAARRELRIVAGNDALALTPPMGWNSWNVWGPAVDADKVLEAARVAGRSGLAAHGFQYVVIDDAWDGEARRRRRDRAQRKISGHARAGRCRARARPEAGYLFLAGPEDVRGTSRAAGSTRRRTPRPSPPGASIS